MFVCVPARCACARVPGLPRFSTPTFPSLAPFPERALSLPLCLHNHFPSLPECLMESGMGGRTSAFPKGSQPAPCPACCPGLSPCHSAGPSGEGFCPRRDRIFFPRPLLPSGRVLVPSPPPRSVVPGSPQCCLSPGRPAVSSQRRQRGT